MSTEPTDLDIAGVQEIIRNSHLVGIDFYEVSGRRHDVPPEDVGDGQLKIQVQQRISETTFGVRLNAAIILPQGEANASLAGEYELLNGITPTRRALQHFANEVGILTVFPYLREAIATITAKVLDEPVYLPLITRGEIVINMDEE